MTRILTSDLLIADIIASLETEEGGVKHTNEALKALVEKYDLKPGSKIAIDEAQFDEFSHAIEGQAVSIQPGGSSFNTITTLNKLLGKTLEAQFIGAAAEGMYSRIIKRALDSAGISLVPESFEEGQRPQAAVSFVILFPNGERTIATYPGNAKDVLKPEMITDDMVENTDILLVQGSLWRKFDWDFADKLLELRWKHNKELWMTLPTNATFGENNAEHFQWALTSADVILSNDDELARIYKTDKETALRRMQQELEHHKVLEWEGKPQRRKPVAFVTRGKEPAAIITAHEPIKYVPTVIKQEEIVNTLGAGDTSFAGFLAGHISGLELEQSAHLAMVLAGEKLKVNGPRIDDPRAALEKASPDLAHFLHDAQLRQQYGEVSINGQPSAKVRDQKAQSKTELTGQKV